MRITEFSKIADILSKSHRVTLKEGKGWAANIKERTIYYKKADLMSLSEDMILGLILHEIAHVHYTTEVKPEPVDNKELMHTTINMLEDIAIEHIISGDYPNAGEILQSTETEMLDTLVRMLPKMDKVSIHEKSLLYGTTRFRGRGYKFGKEEYEKIGDEIAKIMGSRMTEIYDRKKTSDIVPLAKTIVDFLVKKAGQPTQQQKDEMMRGAEGHTKAGDYTENQTSTKKLIKGLADKPGGKGYGGNGDIEPSVMQVNEIIDQADMIGKKLRTVLKRNNAMEFGGRYRTGKLLAKKIVRVVAMKDRRPFARRIIKSNQSYAFAIASDVSGSMFENSNMSNNQAGNGDYTLSSMQMVGEALRKAAVPRAMIIFGGVANVVAPMGKTAIRWESMAEERQIRKAHPSNTDISQAIDACALELSKVRAERKVMIVLTDGSSNEAVMREAHKNAVTQGIECLGITIGNGGGTMDRVFTPKKNIRITDSRNTEAIGKAFITLLQKTITKSV